jgi:hypothetical protein
MTKDSARSVAEHLGGEVHPDVREGEWAVLIAREDGAYVLVGDEYINEFESKDDLRQYLPARTVPLL